MTGMATPQAQRYTETWKRWVHSSLLVGHRIEAHVLCSGTTQGCSMMERHLSTQNWSSAAHNSTAKVHLFSCFECSTQ